MLIDSIPPDSLPRVLLTALTVNIILFVSMIIFCPITVTFVHVLTRDLQNYALTLVEQTQVSCTVAALLTETDGTPNRIVVSY